MVIDGIRIPFTRRDGLMTGSCTDTSILRTRRFDNFITNGDDHEPRQWKQFAPVFNPTRRFIHRYVQRGQFQDGCVVQRDSIGSR